MERGHRISVLDHGYVTYVDSMGSDETVIESARMSTGKGFVAWKPYKRCKDCASVEIDGVLEATATPCLFHEWAAAPRGDNGLLETLYREMHSTPFECGGELLIEVQAPLFVIREWHRHRTQSYNEFSARYAEMPNLHYAPSEDRLRMQAKTNAQGSDEEVHPRAKKMAELIATEQQNVYELYQDLLEEGVAREIARINTPVSRYTRMRAKTDLWNWLRFLKLRMAPQAQEEIRLYAQAVSQIVQTLWPKTYALFEKYDLYAMRFSEDELKLIDSAVQGQSGPDYEALRTRLGGRAVR